ncbi:Enhancer of polycomb-like protein 1 [Friedmanniomyces endolithicus]|nr:Enhancer of polycomb-like protein 1 [Friedmanniomyces endolithicus]KAK0931649.1 Enhancer of polycomb-like protein 1 [Friedmanniomyces endolithicus]KAK1810018.1 Enhancer of polycomb-like protein 1 [Friedmanniomyces endolithicus]
MSTRNNAARTVRQRKLNPKQGLRIIRESEIEEQLDDESQRQVYHGETGVEKAEEIEYHLQAVINASNATALGAKAKQNYIPTPDAVRAKGVQYDELYPKIFKEPATYIRFSSTVEDCIGLVYCMNDADVEFLARLNDGKDVDGRDRKDKLGQCSQHTYEEVMTFFEDTSARLQPFASVDGTPILALEEMERSQQEEISAEAQSWLGPIYKYWVLRKGSRPLMPSIRVRVLDTASEADDADPYVCFRRREVRLTRKTRGRDAQVVEKLKKLRLEAQSALELVRLVADRERVKADSLQIDRRVFNERKQLKEVKAAKNIIGEKGDDEELLVNQKPMSKMSKGRGDSQTQRPATIRLRSVGDGRAAAPDVDLPLLDDWRAEAEQFVITTIEARKEQHKKWNQHWVDETKLPITPPLEENNPIRQWAQFPPDGLNSYPTPSPSLPSQSSQQKESEDVEMPDEPPRVEEGEQATAGADFHEPLSVFHIPGAYPLSDVEDGSDAAAERSSYPACRLRYGRGGRCYLETRKRRPFGQLSRGVVSDSESDEDNGPEYFPVAERITFDYRAALNKQTRPDGLLVQQHSSHGRWPSGDQASIMSGAGTHGRPGSQGGSA